MIIHPHQTEHFDLLGGKARALGQLSGTGCNIPSWFAVTEDGTHTPDDILKSAQLLENEHFAVRSSARGEDGVEHSFAGQYDTFL
jgi:pyruvate,water dikinase